MAIRRRRKDAPGNDSGEATLVYSTGGGLQADRPHAPNPLRPDASRVRLSLDRRGSGRVVTVVTGVVGGEDALGILAKELKSACGAGGTAKDGVIEIQGDHRDAVDAALRSRGFAPKRSGG